MATVQRSVAVLVLVLLGATPCLAGENLAKIYPGKLGWSGSGLPWTCSADDVWRLQSFEFEAGKDLSFECGEATVAFGVHDGNVLWAVVFPDEPPVLETRLLGGGEHAWSILLRFAPSEVGKVFPRKTVVGRGQPWRRAEADRIFRKKVGWKWSTPAGNPTVVPAGWYLVDVETLEGTRRFYGVDRNSGSIEYVAEFDGKPLPPLTAIDSEAAVAAFDEVWAAFDTEYPKFGLLPDLDWKTLGDERRELAAGAQTTFALGAVLADMLAELRDLHVWVKAGDDWLPGYSRDRPLNANWTASLAHAAPTTDTKQDLVWGRTDDDIGYLNVHALGDAALPGRFDEALEALADTWGLIIDLRFNGGGDEGLAQQIAGRLVDEPRVYSTNQYRAGPAHDDLGEVLQRRVEPRGPWRYESPVVVLWGQRTLSSAESLALMLAQCPQVTTMGDRTGGSSANPRRLELSCGISVNLPRWLDMDPDGNSIEHVGVAPDVVLDVDGARFTNDSDPVMEAALKRLRKTSKRRREPGKRAG